VHTDVLPGGGGAYPNIAAYLQSLKNRGVTDNQVRDVMSSITRGTPVGGVGGKWVPSHEEARTLASLSRLLLSVEGGRNQAALVTNAAMINLVGQPGLSGPAVSAEELATTVNAMSPRGAVRGAYELNRELGLEPEGRYRTNPTAEHRRNRDNVRAHFLENLLRILQAELAATHPIVHNEETMRRLIMRHIREILRVHAQAIFNLPI
jgi:hypothetical protein